MNTSTMSKVVQHEIVRAADPSLAFETAVFSHPADLERHLDRQDSTKVLRPEYSADTGSALFARPGRPIPRADLAMLWREGGDRVVVHEFVPGIPCFANGVVIGGELRLTDTWRCFGLEEGPRWLLTSVVNVLPGSSEVRTLERALQALVTECGVRNGPACFEAVLSGEQVKVVKFAYRLAGQPLPRLCGLLGISGQSGQSAETPDGFVADYAFIVQRGGMLAGFSGLEEVRALASYTGDLFLPSPGDRLNRTVGEGGGAAVLLRHADEDTLLRDVQRLQEINRAGFFVVTSSAEN
jgi:hypothetical protein